MLAAVPVRKKDGVERWTGSYQWTGVWFRRIEMPDQVRWVAVVWCIRRTHSLHHSCADVSTLAVCLLFCVTSFPRCPRGAGAPGYLLLAVKRSATALSGPGYHAWLGNTNNSDHPVALPQSEVGELGVCWNACFRKIFKHNWWENLHRNYITCML